MVKKWSLAFIMVSAILTLPLRTSVFSVIREVLIRSDYIWFVREEGSNFKFIKGNRHFLKRVRGTWLETCRSLSFLTMYSGFTWSQSLGNLVKESHLITWLHQESKFKCSNKKKWTKRRSLCRSMRKTCHELGSEINATLCLCLRNF